MIAHCPLPKVKVVRTAQNIAPSPSNCSLGFASFGLLRNRGEARVGPRPDYADEDISLNFAANICLVSPLGDRYPFGNPSLSQLSSHVVSDDRPTYRVLSTAGPFDGLGLSSTSFPLGYVIIRRTCVR
jgi:hypothetical protein